jgi:hypothetical protein
LIDACAENFASSLSGGEAKFHQMATSPLEMLQRTCPSPRVVPDIPDDVMPSREIADMSGSTSAAVISVSNEDLPTGDVQSRIADLEIQLEALREKEEKNMAENGRLIMEMEELVKERERQAKDNNILRSLVVNLRQPLAPRFEDEYYIYRMQRLNESVKSWVVLAFKEKEVEQPMSETEEEQLIHLLRTNLPEHIVWLEAVRQRSGLTYASIHAKPQARIALARHLIALSIWKNIFRPLCFGISGDLKDGIRTVMDSVYAEGTISPQSLVYFSLLIGRKRNSPCHGYQAGYRSWAPSTSRTMSRTTQAIACSIPRSNTYITPPKTLQNPFQNQENDRHGGGIEERTGM